MLKMNTKIKTLTKGTLVAACVMAFLLAAEHPGKCKANPGTLSFSGNDQNALLNIPGYAEWGMGITDTVPKVSQKLQGVSSKVERIDNGLISPYLSKTDATQDLLLSLKGKEQVPQEMKEILMRDTVSVSVRFTHELTAAEIQSIEELGVEFCDTPRRRDSSLRRYLWCSTSLGTSK